MNTLFYSFTLDIEAVSCDEMFVDVTDVLRSIVMNHEKTVCYACKRVDALVVLSEKREQKSV